MMADAATPVASASPDKVLEERATIGLNLRKIEFKQDQWENVPSLVYKSFYAHSVNMSAIKKWSDKVEERAKEAAATDKKLEERIDSVAHGLDAARKDAVSQVDEFRETASRLKTQSDACVTCLKQLLQTTSFFLTSFAGVYCAQREVDVVQHARRGKRRSCVPDADGSPVHRPLHYASSSSSLRVPSRQYEGDLFQHFRRGKSKSLRSDVTGSRSGSEYAVDIGANEYMDEEPEEQEDDDAQHSEVEKEDASEERGSQAPEEEEGEDVVARPSEKRVSEELRSLGSSIEGQMRKIVEAFEEWGQQRATESEDKRLLQEKVETIRIATERSRERLLSWRELLKESTNATDSLAASLLQAQAEIQELREQQMVREDVEGVVNDASARLEALHDVTEQRVVDVSTRMEVHATHLDSLAREHRKETKDHVEEHSLKIAQLLERNLTPVNAYLNTLHVKADGLRADVDSVRSQLPTVSSRVDEVASELKEWSGEANRRDVDLGARLDHLWGEAHSFDRNANDRCDALAGSIYELGEHLSQEVGGVGSTVAGTNQEVDMLRRLDIGGLRKDLQTLEQKVAKWIYAEPLPSKLSEARLYALEARLAEETDARLLLEEQMKLSSGGLAPFSSRGDNKITSLNLPMLGARSGRSGHRAIKEGAHTERPSAGEPRTNTTDAVAIATPRPRSLQKMLA